MPDTAVSCYFRISHLTLFRAVFVVQKLIPEVTYAFSWPCFALFCTVLTAEIDRGNRGGKSGNPVWALARSGAGGRRGRPGRRRGRPAFFFFYSGREKNRPRKPTAEIEHKSVNSGMGPGRENRPMFSDFGLVLHCFAPESTVLCEFRGVGNQPPYVRGLVLHCFNRGKRGKNMGNPRQKYCKNDDRVTRQKQQRTGLWTERIVQNKHLRRSPKKRSPNMVTA